MSPNQPPERSPCPSCKGLFEPIDGPTHRYMESSPGCWDAFSQILAREYADPEFWPAHRLSVDTYAIQHPGKTSPQAIQSVAVHLIGLYAVFELKKPHSVAAKMIKKAAESLTFAWLPPPEDLGSITVAHVLPARTPEQHCYTVRCWAECAWEAWKAHHPQVRQWALCLQFT